MATSAKSQGCDDSRAVVSRASNRRWVKPSVGDSGGTEGLRTCSAGECSSTGQVRCDRQPQLTGERHRMIGRGG